MRLLLDTHVAVWSMTERARIPKHILEMIADRQNDVFVSICSLVELAIKSRLGRGTARALKTAMAKTAFEEAEFKLLDITSAHALSLETLLFDHGDPFDRLILAQSIAEPMHLVSKDSRLAAYSDTVISW